MKRQRDEQPDYRYHGLSFTNREITVPCDSNREHNHKLGSLKHHLDRKGDRKANGDETCHADRGDNNDDYNVGKQTKKNSSGDEVNENVALQSQGLERVPG